MQRTRARAKPGPKPSSSARRSDSADEILQTAAELFVRNGYQGTSLAAIGERLGMTPAAIYYHFRSKEDLLFAYVDGVMSELVRATDEALAGLPSPAERLRAFMSTYVTFHLSLLERLSPGSSVTYGLSHLISGLTAANGRKMLKSFWTYLAGLDQIIEDGVASGDFSTSNVTASAFAMIGMVEHAGLWFHPSNDLSVADVADLYASHAVNMLTGS